MKLVSALLAKRALPVCSVKPEDTVFHALQVLAEHEVGALVVMEGDQLVGVISERDYTRKVALQNKSSKDTLVRDIMTRGVLVVTPQTGTRACAAAGTTGGPQRLPLRREGGLRGQASEHRRRRGRAHQPAHGQHRSG